MNQPSASRDYDLPALGLAVKRSFDVIAALLLLILLSPALAAISVGILLDSGWPILFTQDRLGLHGRTFKIIKFRTMVVGAEQQGSGLRTLRGDGRITRIGSILRTTSLDELPQLINVLRGDMSLVGPRPPATYHPYVRQEYPQEYLPRFEMRPGMTGLAQTSGRNSLTWQDRLALDVQYVDHWCLLDDLRILVSTVRVLLNKDGAVVDKPTEDA